MEHLSREQLEQYRDRTLAPHSIPAASVHLAQCADCRDALAGLASTGAAASLLAEIADARSEHLTLEQMDGWVDESMDDDDDDGH